MIETHDRHVQEEEVGFPSRLTSNGQTGQHGKQERQKESVSAADWTRHVTCSLHTTTAVQLVGLFHPVLAFHLFLSLYTVRGGVGLILVWCNGVNILQDKLCIISDI